MHADTEDRAGQESSAGTMVEGPGLGPYGTWPYVERRGGGDRRARRTRLFSRHILTGQRMVGRREGEGRNLYVDRYHPRDLLLAAAILLLNILDAWFTLDYIGNKNGSEANPLARWILEELGTGWFIFSKAVVVALCVLFLLVHKTFRCVRPALLALLFFYGALLAYHLYLQITVPQAIGG